MGNFLEGNQSFGKRRSWKPTIKLDLGKHLVTIWTDWTELNWTEVT